MKHAILGAGAIGGLMATALSSVAEDVRLIVRPENLATYPQTLRLNHPNGTITASVKTTTRLTEHVDVLWIATKTYQLEEALTLVETAPGIVVSLLNGIDHIAILRSRFGHERIVPATIAVEAERSAPGHFTQRSPARLNIAASGEPVLKDLVERLRSLGWKCEFISNEATLLWTKLCFLEPFALVTSASGKNNGEILSDHEWKGKLESAIREAAAVALKEGAQIDIARGADVFANFPPTMRASMAKDLAAGRKLELDGIAGPIVRGGVKHGVPTPMTDTLVAMIEEKVRALRGAPGPRPALGR